MLKRMQILLEDWQVEYAMRAAKRFDFSLSEVVRILVSEAIMSILFSLEPNKKIGISQKQLTKMKRQVLNSKSTSEERHRIISRVYFEARKAAEHKISEK